VSTAESASFVLLPAVPVGGMAHYSRGCSKSVRHPPPLFVQNGLSYYLFRRFWDWHARQYCPYTAEHVHLRISQSFLKVRTDFVEKKNMKKLTSPGLAAVVLGLICLVGLVQRLKGSANEPTQASRSQLVNTARLINAAEAKYHADNGNFASWSELHNSAAFAGAKGMMDKAGMSLPADLGSGPEIASDLTLKLVVEGNSQYEFRLTDESDQSCHFSAFSDEKGLIFEGSVIGCTR
jgi:hypothetical protein